MKCEQLSSGDMLHISEILRNQKALQESLVALMTDVNKIKGALLKSNVQDTEGMFECDRHDTVESFTRFCDTLSSDSSKLQLYVGIISLL